MIDAPRFAELAVAVPVRNEVDRLPRLLTALANQGSGVPFTLCLFFDNCSDGSAELIASWAERVPFEIVSDACLSGGAPNAGAARRRAMALAGDRLESGVLLTTDADSEPAADWIAMNVKALEHADVVAGRIIRGEQRTPDAQDRVCAYFDRLHALRRALDPVPWEGTETHHWTSGASLAVRADIYRRLGGFAARVSGEDAAFSDSAARAGYRVRRDARVIVRTSSRRKGRARNGFAASLAALDDFGTASDLVHPDDEAWRFRMQATARAAYNAQDLRSLPQLLGLPPAEVETVAAACVNAEAFVARIVGAPPGGLRMVSLAHAEALLAGADQLAMMGAA
jgi:glycosyltransferase involved in cell wall biosynthesis